MGQGVVSTHPQSEEGLKTRSEAQQTKYHNVVTAVDGIRFDSKKEAARYRALMAMLQAGAIRDLKLQPEFTLIEAFKMPDGTQVKAERYRADFSYVQDGELIIEDVKSPATRKNRVYINKRKQMADKGYKIMEV